MEGKSWKFGNQVENLDGCHNIQHLEVSMLSVIGISIKLTLWEYLEKLERKFGDFPNQIEKLDRWQNLEKLEDIKNWKQILKHLKVSNTRF